MGNSCVYDLRRAHLGGYMGGPGMRICIPVDTSDADEQYVRWIDLGRTPVDFDAPYAALLTHARHAVGAGVHALSVCEALPRLHETYKRNPTFELYKLALKMLRMMHLEACMDYSLDSQTHYRERSMRVRGVVDSEAYFQFVCDAPDIPAGCGDLKQIAAYGVALFKYVRGGTQFTRRLTAEFYARYMSYLVHITTALPIRVAELDLRVFCVLSMAWATNAMPTDGAAPVAVYPLERNKLDAYALAILAPHFFETDNGAVPYRRMFGAPPADAPRMFATMLPLLEAAQHPATAALRSRLQAA